MPVAMQFVGVVGVAVRQRFVPVRVAVSRAGRDWGFVLVPMIGEV